MLTPVHYSYSYYSQISAQTLGSYTTVSSSAVEFVSYEGPAASFVMGEIDEYDYENDSVDVEYTVKCGGTPTTPATTVIETGKLGLKTTNYGKSHFNNRVARFGSVSDCIQYKADLQRCFKDTIKPTAFARANDTAGLFENCFKKIPNVHITL